MVDGSCGHAGALAPGAGTQGAEAAGGGAHAPFVQPRPVSQETSHHAWPYSQATMTPEHEEPTPGCVVGHTGLHDPGASQAPSGPASEAPATLPPQAVMAALNSKMPCLCICRTVLVAPATRNDGKWIRHQVLVGESTRSDS